MAKKKKDKGALLFFGLAGAGALAFFLWPKKAKAGVIAGKPGTAPATGCPSVSAGTIAKVAGTPSGKSSEYSQWLLDHAAESIQALRTCYDKNKLRAITKQAAAYYGINPEWIWGVMYTETGGKWRPIGLFGANGAHPEGGAGAVPIAASDYGMSQITLKRFIGEKALHPERFPWEHGDLVDPELAIWSTAASYRRAVEKKGAGISWDDLGQWWAGKGGNWQRKRDTMKAHGPSVHNSDP